MTGTRGTPYWASPSGIKGYLDCPARWARKGPASSAMRAGLVRHYVMERKYLDPRVVDLTDEKVTLSIAQQAPDWRYLEPWDRDNVVADVVSAARKPGFLPDPETVISVEGQGIPPEMAVLLYDSILLECKVWEDAGLRMRMDLVCVDFDDDTVVRIPDWKGRSEDDWSLTGMVYAIGVYRAFLANGMIPGVTRIVFDAIYLGSNKKESYEYEVAKIPEYASTVKELVDRMRSDDRLDPTLNKWCKYCHLQGQCPAYANAVTSPAPVSTVEAVQEYQLPAESGDLIDLREKLKLGTTILEALDARVSDELKKRLEGGPIHHAGRDYSLQERTSRYDVDDEKACAFADSWQIPVGKIAAVSHSKLKQEVDRVVATMKRDKDTPEAIESVLSGFDACRTPRKSKVIVGKTPKVSKKESSDA